jgi:hypothetical protein
VLPARLAATPFVSSYLAIRSTPNEALAFEVAGNACSSVTVRTLLNKMLKARLTPYLLPDFAVRDNKRNPPRAFCLKTPKLLALLTNYGERS